MEEKDFYTFEEIKDEFIGGPGTPEREAYERELESDLATGSQTGRRHRA